jgi:hypothetical protein
VVALARSFGTCPLVVKDYFVTKPFFPRGELTEVVGAHGTGKSTILLDACLDRHGSPLVRCSDESGPGGVRDPGEPRGHPGASRPGSLGRIDDPAERAAAQQAARSGLAFLARERSQALVLNSTREGSTA